MDKSENGSNHTTTSWKITGSKNFVPGRVPVEKFSEEYQRRVAEETEKKKQDSVKLPCLSEMITRILEDYGFRVDPVSSWVAYKANKFV